MRVRHTQRSMTGAGARRSRRPGEADGAFRPSQGAAARRPSPARGPAPVGGVEMLVALQGIEEGSERRRRAVRQGRAVLDELDDLKLALLSGRLAPAKLAALRALVARYQAYDGDPELADLLRQIDLRARVELAKHAKSAA